MILAEKWQKDLEVYRDINTAFIIEGNVHDYQPYIYEDDGTCEPVSLGRFLDSYLSEAGYDPVVFYDRIDGFHNGYSPEMEKTFRRTFDVSGDGTEPIGSATEIIRRAMTNTIRPCAVVIDLANTIAGSPDNLTDEETEYFTRLMLATREPTQAKSVRNGRQLFSLLFLIVDRVNDVPLWFYLNNPYVRTLSISRPDKEVRASLIDSRLDTMIGAEELTEEERSQIKDQFAAMTEGMTLVEVFGIFTLCRQKGYSVRQVREAVKLFRFGETESHWDKLGMDKVRSAGELLSRRVKGQPAAVRQAADIISRACLGMTGIQGGPESRPKGVMFLAGPTGTGKTELARTVAELIFGDESFVTRFDMSEYQQPHSDQKLLGAPPGYIGYSDGGQLTNALKTKPFSVLLFDEIDKAHPSILDKFLQILEDGRITDSAGETVFFSESLIIFTSNLGVVAAGEDGRAVQTVTPDMSYEEIRQVLLRTIKDHFKYTIRRPELLNRIGDNFIVFDFIRPDAAREILDIKLEAVAENLSRTRGIDLELTGDFKEQLAARACADLSNGGRGIGNLVETLLINPLARLLAEHGPDPVHTLTVKALTPGGLEADWA